MKEKVEKHRIIIYKAGPRHMINMQVFISIFILIFSSSSRILAAIKYS